MNLKTLTTLTIVVLLVPALVCQGGTDNTVTFDNQSGQPAIVKLVGPTPREVEVPVGQMRTVAASAGQYHIKTRYGTPDRYRYTKGDEFVVKDTATTRSRITITLHKVVDGNYDSDPICAEDFEASETLGNAKVTSPASSDSASVHVGSNPRGDTVLWKDGSIWRHVTITKLENKTGQPILTIKDAPKGSKGSEFRDFVAISLRGGDWPPPKVKTPTSALVMYDSQNMMKGVASAPKSKTEAYQDFFTSESNILEQNRLAKPPYSTKVSDDKTGDKYFAQFAITIPYIRVRDGICYVYICPNEGGGHTPERWYRDINGAYFDRKKDNQEE